MRLRRIAVGSFLILLGGTVSCTKPQTASDSVVKEAGSPVEDSANRRGPGHDNPAAFYCSTLGYQVERVSTDRGQHSACVFPDGTRCDVWAFFAGTCGESFSLCSQRHYRQTTKSDGKDPYSKDYAVCVDPQTNEEVGSITQLLNLVERYQRTIFPIEVGPKSVPRNQRTSPLGGGAALPAAFDWRNHNGSDWMTGVRDQSQCGSCWAHAAIGITEAVYNIATNNPNLGLDLSEEYLNSDSGSGSPAPNNTASPGNCCGGFHDQALNLIKNNGVPDEVCMPYDVAYYGGSPCNCYPDPMCSATCSGLPMSCSHLNESDACTDVAMRLVKIADYGSVPNDVAQIKQKLIDKGPLAAGIGMSGTMNAANIYDCTACWDQNNNSTCEKTGVCTAGMCTSGLMGFDCKVDADCDEDKNNDGKCDEADCSTNHVVVIAGYDDAQGAWIVKNSWGDTWNGNGYFDVGYGECHIQESVYYADAATLPNLPPICRAGGPYGAECSGATTNVTLNGTGSSDPNSDPLSYAWAGAFAGGTASGAAPTVAYSGLVTDSNVDLTVGDGTFSATCNTAVTVQDTTPPVVPPDITIECTSPLGSTAPIGSPTDVCDPNVIASNNAPSLFPFGPTTVIWMARDHSNNMVTPPHNKQVVTVVDTTPPNLSIAVTPDILWPPNHMLRNVHVSVTVSDTCDAAPTVRLESITSSEPDSGTGSFDKPNDIQGASLGTDDRVFRLRAEHSTGGARTYTITYSATDKNGKSTTRSATVRVPKSYAELISRDGVRANGASIAVAVTTNGHAVVFPADATNLVSGGLGRDTNEARDVFLRNRDTCVTDIVSTDAAGMPANGPSHAQGHAPAVSGDGRFVAFYSDASDLLGSGGDTNGQTDVFVSDRTTGMTERVSVSTGGGEANGPSLYPSISEDGRFVVFQSLASNLISGDANGVADIFIHDRTTHTTERVCGAIEPNGPSSTPAISPDGHFVAFASAATNLIAHDRNGRVDIFVCNLSAGSIDLVSVSSAGVQGNGDSILPAISRDGAVVAYKSLASNLVLNDRNDLVDVFATERGTMTTERISVNRTGGDADDVSFPPSLSFDGRFVAFGSLATNLVPGDTNNTSNVFVRDRQSNVTLIADVNDDGEIGNRGTLDVAPAVSGDGVQIGFVSLASNLAGLDNEVPDVFVVCNPFLPTPPAPPACPLIRRRGAPFGRVQHLNQTRATLLLHRRPH